MIEKETVRTLKATKQVRVSFYGEDDNSLNYFIFSKGSGTANEYLVLYNRIIYKNGVINIVECALLRKEEVACLFSEKVYNAVVEAGLFQEMGEEIKRA